MYSAMAPGPTVPVTAHSQKRDRGQSSFHRSSEDGAGAEATDADAAIEGAAGAGSLALAADVVSSTSIDRRTRGRLPWNGGFLGSLDPPRWRDGIGQRRSRVTLDVIAPQFLAQMHLPVGIEVAT